MGLDSLANRSYCLRDHFLLVARLDHTTGSRNIKPEVVFEVQKMAQYASFNLTMGLYKGEMPILPDYDPLRLGLGLVLTGAVRSAILATAGLLVKGTVVRSNFAIFSAAFF